MEVLARNLYYFFHVILKAAHTEPLWTRNSLEKSIQWAKYCEKVYYEAISKGYASDVAMLLKDMNKLTAGQRVVTFDDLKVSSQLLVTELLQCPALRKGTVEIILNSQLIEAPWLEVVCEVLVINSVLKDLVIKEENSQTRHGTALEAHMKKLSALSGNALDMQLDMLARTSPELLLRIVCCEENVYQTVSCYTAQWLSQRLAASDEQVSVSVWAQEIGLLCQAACKDPGFLQCLLRRLQAHAETMEPCFTAGADEWVPTRRSPAEAWDWKHVTGIWIALGQVKNSTVASVVTAFREQMQCGPRGDFWDDLTFYCESSSNIQSSNATKACNAISGLGMEESFLLKDCCR
uniref:Fanconi anemia group F protein n=1 Tax=Amblyomma maculatum TaxID=34609 RepID=G3MMC4_AMBMU